MNCAFNRLHLVNTYGAFGSVTRERYEVIVEGTGASEPSPGARRGGSTSSRASRATRGAGRAQFAPYHLRLDWLMWFAALSPRYAEPWFRALVERLLDGDRRVAAAARAAIRSRTRRRAWIRARSTATASRPAPKVAGDGRWWSRELAGDFLTPVSLAKKTE